jgi:hypothetical protein
MKIDLLKLLIREMAWDHVLGDLVNSKKLKSTRNKVLTPELQKKHDSLKKYHSSKAYISDAKYVFKNFQTPIWIVPLFDPWMDFTGPRVYTLSFDDALDYIVESGIGLTDEEKKSGEIPNLENEDLRLDRVEDHLNSGGALVISSSKALVKNFWPSPWMILHAIADDVKKQETNEIHKELLENFNKSLNTWENETTEVLRKAMRLFMKSQDQLAPDASNPRSEWDSIRYETDLYIAFQRARAYSMTMASARKKIIDPRQISDIIAEAFVQSITHSKQFHIDEEKIEDNLNSALKLSNLPIDNLELRNIIKEKIKEYVVKVRELRDHALATVDAMLAGKIVVVHVVDID